VSLAPGRYDLNPKLFPFPLSTARKSQRADPGALPGLRSGRAPGTVTRSPYALPGLSQATPKVGAMNAHVDGQGSGP
jgi:hypothetical protein